MLLKSAYKSVENRKKMQAIVIFTYISNIYICSPTILYLLVATI